MWSEGTIACPETGKIYKYWVKHYETGSEYGIEEGKISKLCIRKVGESRDIVNYDRGWDVEVPEELKAVYAIILDKYN